MFIYKALSEYLSVRNSTKKINVNLTIKSLQLFKETITISTEQLILQVFLPDTLNLRELTCFKCKIRRAHLQNVFLSAELLPFKIRK